MKSSSKLIIGCGGHSRALISVLLDNDESESIQIIENKIGFDPNEKILGTPVTNDINYLKLAKQECILGIGLIDSRFQIIHGYKSLTYFNVISRRSIMSREVQLGQGIFIGPNSFIGPEVIISDHVIINSSSVIEHEVSIGCNSHIAPSSTLLGRCMIGENVLIGAGTVILPGVKIGNNITIGANSLVNRNVLESGKYVGSPIKLINK